MKKLIKKSVLFMLLLSTVLVNANVIDSVRVLNESNATLLMLSNVKKGNLLSISDAFGVILYEERIQESGDYMKHFDLSTLPDGSYYFELNKGVEIRIIPFSLKSNLVTLKKAMEVIISKPLMRTQDNLVYVTKSALNKQDVQVDIFYNENDSYNLIYSEKIKTDNKLKVYRLDKKEKGNYKIVYHIEDKTFSEHFQF